jgi:hypothetical protein
MLLTLLNLRSLTLRPCPTEAGPRPIHVRPNADTPVRTLHGSHGECPSHGVAVASVCRVSAGRRGFLNLRTENREQRIKKLVLQPPTPVGTAAMIALAELQLGFDCFSHQCPYLPIKARKLMLLHRDGRGASLKKMKLADWLSLLALVVFLILLLVLWATRN